MSITAAPGLRDRLKAIEERVEELRDEIQEAEKDERAAQAEYAGLENVVPGTPEFAAAKDATRKVGELRDELAAVQAEQTEVLRMLGSSDPAARRAREALGPNTLDNRPAVGWDSAPLLTQEVGDRLERFANTKAQLGQLQLGKVVTAENFAADIAPTANMRRGDYYGVLPQLQRALRLLDLIPSAQMTGNNIPYTRESGAFTDAAETAEGATKPEAGVTYTDDEALARVVAGWMKLPKPALSDVPALRGIIDQRLRYIVLRRLEAQIINGNGTAPNLRGLLNTSGIGAVAYDAGELAADQILTGIVNVLLADAMADGILMHPTDWAAVLKVKAAGDGHYYSAGPFSVTPQVIWGVPLIPSPAVPAGMVLVGDFSIGVQLFVREGIQVLFSDSDGTDFIQNRVTLLGEGRFALPVWRPSAFSSVDVAP
jgi:HK97 family phage major capsid protein